MPFGNNRWNREFFIGYEEIKSIVEAKYPLKEIAGQMNRIAKDYFIAGHSGKVSFISAISNHFCGTCNRLRIDAQGKMKLCLFSTGENELNFKELLNNPYLSDDDICDKISNSLYLKEKSHPEVDELLKLEENKMLSIGG